MNVLIVEHDDLIAATLADALADVAVGIAVASDDAALALVPHEGPLIVITGMNREHPEDLAGMKLVGRMRKKCPALCVIYLAALWPARLNRHVMTVRERFLEKPVPLAELIGTVRELMRAGLCCQRGELLRMAGPKRPRG